MNNELIDLEGEIWKSIDEFPNYMVSNKGRVKSLGNNKSRKDKILKPRTRDTYGHQFVGLCHNGIKTYKLVHRLVGEVFIPNHENKPQIDHIDTNPENNCVENLRWVTPKENNNNPLSRINSRDAKGGQPIYCFEIDKIYSSTMDAERELNINHSSISRCCKGKHKSAGGYHFCYASEMPDMLPLFLQ